MDIKKVTLEDIKNLPEISKERLEEIKNFPEDFTDPDCPLMTKEQIKNLRPLRDVHPEWYKPTKSKITIMLDNDVLAVLKSEGKGYQTKINSILRKAVMGA